MDLSELKIDLRFTLFAPTQTSSNIQQEGDESESKRASEKSTVEKKAFSLT